MTRNRNPKRNKHPDEGSEGQGYIRKSKVRVGSHDPDEDGIPIHPTIVFTDLGTVEDVLCPSVPGSPKDVAITYCIRDGPFIDADRACFRRISIDEIGRRVLVFRNDEAFIFIPEDSVRMLLDLRVGPSFVQDSDHGFVHYIIGSKESSSICMDELIASYTFEYTL